MENAKVVHDFLHQCFASKCSRNTAQVSEAQSRDWENEACLRNLKVKKCKEIHLWVLRELAEKVAKTLSAILKKSWQLGEFPIDWKRGNLSPIFKSGDKEDPGNYTRASLTSVPGRI